MTLRTSDLRSGTWAHLMEIDLEGSTLRFGEVAVESVTFGPLGAAVDFIGGLDVGGSVGREIDLFEDVPSSRTLNATLDATARVDAPKMVLAGHTFLGAEVRVYLHPLGTQRREEVFRGVITAFEFQTKADPISLTASSSIGDDVGTVHGPWDKQRHIDLVRDDEQQDTWLPVVFGAPGNGSASTDPEDHMYGSPAFGATQLVAPYDIATISAHPTAVGTAAAGQVFFWNKTKDASGLVDVYHLDTLRGETISYADINPPAAQWEIGDEMWIDWGASEGGLAGSGGALLRGAGDVLHWMATRARGVKMDLPRIESIRDRLNAFKIDVAVWGVDGEHVRPLEWVNEYLIPMLPVSAVAGPGGLSYSVWDPDATSHDAVATLNTATGGNAARISDVESSDLSDIANDITVRYGFDAKSGKPTKERRIVGDPEIAAESGTVRLGLWAQRSQQRFGRRVAPKIDLPAVWDDTTADMAAAWLERRWSLPTYAVSYECRPDLAYLRPGDVVTIKDAGLRLSDRVALVTVATPERSGTVKVRVRIYEGG